MPSPSLQTQIDILPVSWASINLLPVPGCDVHLDPRRAFLLENLHISSTFPWFPRNCLEPSPLAIPVLWYTFGMTVATLFSIVFLIIALWWHVWTVVSEITDIIHLKKQLACFLLARLNPELSRAMCCTNNRYTRIPASPSLSLSYEVDASNATPARRYENRNYPAVLTKGIAINDGADEGALIASSKYSSTKFSRVRPSWVCNSSLLTSALCWMAQLRRFRDTSRSIPFRQFSSSFVVSRAVHQGRALFLVAPYSRGSLVSCFSVSWC